MFKFLFRLSLTASTLIGLLGSCPAWTASPMRLGLLEIRGIATGLPLQRMVARSYSTHPYTVPTYDDAFKDIMMNEIARNSFFSASTHEPIESSVLLGLTKPNDSSPDQISIDSVDNFLEKYRTVIETYLKTRSKTEKQENTETKPRKKVYSINILGGYEVSSFGERRYTWEDQQKTVHGKKTIPSFIKRYELTNKYDPSQHIPHLQIIQLYPQMFDQKSSDLSFLKEKESHTLAFIEWLNFFKDAHKRTEKEVEETVKDEGVKMAYSILKRHEPTEKYKEWCDLYGVKYAEHIAQEAAESARNKSFEIARKMLVRGRPLEEIMDDTGLTKQEVEDLMKPVD